MSEGRLMGKRIHFVVPRYHTNMVPWVSALQEAGVHVSMDVVTHGATEDHRHLTPLLLPQSRVSRWMERRRGPEGVNRPLAFPPLAWFLRHLWRVRPDVLVVRDPSRYVSRAAMLCSLFLRTRLVLYNQLPVDRAVGVRRMVAIRLINQIFGAWWMSPVRSGSGAEGVGFLPRHRFIPFVAQRIRSARQGTRHPVRLLSIGKFEPRKHHLMLVDAFERLVAMGHDIELRLVGQMSTPAHQALHERLTRRIQDAGLTDRITVLTNQPPTEMDGNYAWADLFVLPSSAEPASVSVIEAMGHGLPVICSDQNGTRCYISPSRNGDIFLADHLDSLTEIVDRMLNRLRADPVGTYQMCEMDAHALVGPERFLDAITPIFRPAS